MISCDFFIICCTYFSTFLCYQKKQQQEVEAQDGVQVDETSIISEPTAVTMSTAFQESDSIALLYNLCEDGVEAFLSLCGLSPTDNNKSMEDESLTPQEWLEKSLNVIFYSDMRVKTAIGSSQSQFAASRKESIQKMALNSARIKHRSRGLIYDETQSMNLMKEVKLVVVRVAIPIGGMSISSFILSQFHFQCL